MTCDQCHLFTPGDRCGNPGCPSNEMSQHECAVCRTISPGLVCSNPGCSTCEVNATLRDWNQKLIRSQYQGVDWGQLLNILDSVTVNYITEVKESPILKIVHSGRTIFCPKGKNWLWLCSDKDKARLKWAPATIQLRYYGFVVNVELRGSDVRVHFPKFHFFDRTDLRYFEIGALFSRMNNHPVVAHEILQRVMGNYTTYFGQGYDGFIDAMVVLLFGVESARNWSTCATSLMLLELVANRWVYGSKRKVFDLAKAFHHPSKTWDDGTLYGGKHPMATHGTGEGNLIARGQIVRSMGVGWDAAVSENPKHHMVIYREASILRYWLEFTDTIPYYNGLSIEGRILRLLQRYLS